MKKQVLICFSMQINDIFGILIALIFLPTLLHAIKHPMPFLTLGLSRSLVEAVSIKKYLQPTSIQTQAIPAILQKNDVLACAQTGSGKTAAFVLPLLEQLLQAPRTTPATTKHVAQLILVPTRELAIQVGETLRGLAIHLPINIKITVVFGGVSINPQMMGLRGGTDIVVATPGRLLDLVAHNALNLSHVKTLVLDEADRLLDLGFSEELERILKDLPAQRQNLLFSATFAPEVQNLAQQMLKNPVHIEIIEAPHNKPDIVQRVICVNPSERTQLLIHLINTFPLPRVLVFVASQHSAEMVAAKLRKAHINAEPFHGGLSQGKRSQVLADLKAKRLTAMIATDMAARGIDVTQLPAVVNFDLPRSTTDYIHRIGRTGRAGQAGLALSFINSSTETHFRLIEKQHGISLLREQVPGFEVENTGPEYPASNAPLDLNGGIKGKRPSKKDKLRAAAQLAAQRGE